MNQPGVYKLPGAGLAPAVESGPETVPQELPPLALRQPAPDSATAHAAKPAAAPAHKTAFAAVPARTAFVPALLMALALTGGFGAQLWDAYQQRQALLATHAAQQQTVDNAGKLRQSLDALAADTQRMADGGNANAALLVTELRQRGITISVPGAAGPAASVAVPISR